MLFFSLTLLRACKLFDYPTVSGFQGSAFFLPRDLRHCSLRYARLMISHGMLLTARMLLPVTGESVPGVKMLMVPCIRLSGARAKGHVIPVWPRCCMFKSKQYLAIVNLMSWMADMHL